MAQSDFTHADELRVMIAGQVFPHLFYHFVMVYSRWEHVGVVLGGERLHSAGREPPASTLVTMRRAAILLDRPPLGRIPQSDYRSARGYNQAL